MLRLGQLGALVAILAIGCGHTVGATEVARRAAVELDCGASHTYVHTIARNHYAAAACGKRAIYICSGGACRRDSELDEAESNAGVVADGRNAHERLNAVREAVLACFGDDEPEPLVLRAEFSAEGELETFDHDVGGRLRKRCIRGALAHIPPAAGPYEHALYIEHTFSSTPWEDLTEPSPASPPEAAEEALDPPVETVDLRGGGTAAAPAGPGEVCGGEQISPGEQRPCREGLTCCPAGGARGTPHICMDLGPNGTCPPYP